MTFFMMNPKINLSFARDLVCTSTSKNDALTSIAVLCLFYLDIFQLKLEDDKRLVLIKLAIRLFEMYENTNHGSGNQTHERAFCTTTIDHVLESLIELQQIVEQNPGIDVDRLSTESVEHFFAATNQKSRCVVSITEEHLINTARHYKHDTFGGGIQFGDRYRNLYSNSGRYRNINKEMIATRLRDFSSLEQIEQKTVEQFRKLWSGEENIESMNCLISVYFEPLKKCSASPNRVHESSEFYPQRMNNLLGKYNTRYQDQVGSRDRHRRYLHPFTIPSVTSSSIGTAQVVAPTTNIFITHFEIDKTYWIHNKTAGLFQMIIIAIHTSKSTPTRPKQQISIYDSANWIFYRITKRLLPIENDAYDFCLLPSVQNSIIYKRKLNVNNIAEKQDYEINVDYREQTPLEILMKSLQRELVDICRRKNLSLGGNKDDLAQRILDARSAGVEDCNPEFVSLMKKSKPELKKLCTEKGVAFKSRDVKITLVNKLCDYEEEARNIIAEKEAEDQENTTISPINPDDFDSDDFFDEVETNDFVADSDADSDADSNATVSNESQ